MYVRIYIYIYKKAQWLQYIVTLSLGWKKLSRSLKTPQDSTKCTSRVPFWSFIRVHEVKLILGTDIVLRCSKFIPRWNYTTLNIGSIHFGGSYEDGIGDRALHHALGPRWRSVPSIWHPFGKMGYLVIGWSMYWLTYPFSGWISHWYLYFSSFMGWLAIFRKWYRYFC